MKSPFLLRPRAISSEEIADSSSSSTASRIPLRSWMSESTLDCATDAVGASPVAKVVLRSFLAERSSLARFW